MVETRFFVVPVRTGEGSLGATTTGHLKLLRGKRLHPLRLGTLNPLGHQMIKICPNPKQIQAGGGGVAALPQPGPPQLLAVLAEPADHPAVPATVPVRPASQQLPRRSAAE